MAACRARRQRDPRPAPGTRLRPLAPPAGRACRQPGNPDPLA
ncbi:hypothetical protein ACPA9J_32090 [Pseudomonas aeruginosa]